MNGLYASQKERVAELHAQGRTIHALAIYFRVDEHVIVEAIRNHKPPRPGSRQKLIFESLTWQAEHGRAV